MTATLPSLAELTVAAGAAASRLGVDLGASGETPVRTPILGTSFGSVDVGQDLDAAVTRATATATVWRAVPAPRRGEVVRVLGELLRTHKADLATLVSIETGKIFSEGLGEVQEMIDICDLAVGLSRQLHGLTIASERPNHRLSETWHPLGPIGVISAFNFPVAVWSWNAALAIVCGDPVVWKPSEKTLLSSAATVSLARRAAAQCGAPDALFELVGGGPDMALAMASHHGLPLVSATGSTAMGAAVGPKVTARVEHDRAAVERHEHALGSPAEREQLADDARGSLGAGLDRVQEVNAEVTGILQTILRFGHVHIHTASENSDMIV